MSLAWKLVVGGGHTIRGDGRFRLREKFRNRLLGTLLEEGLFAARTSSKPSKYAPMTSPTMTVSRRRSSILNFYRAFNGKA